MKRKNDYQKLDGVYKLSNTTQNVQEKDIEVKWSLLEFKDGKVVNKS